MIEELSARELAVLRLVQEGRTNAQIAAALGVTGETVKCHLSRVYATLSVDNRTSAAVALWRHERRTHATALVEGD